jgi:hypothetical protein
MKVTQNNAFYLPEFSWYFSSLIAIFPEPKIKICISEKTNWKRKISLLCLLLRPLVEHGDSVFGRHGTWALSPVGPADRSPSSSSVVTRFGQRRHPASSSPRAPPSSLSGASSCQLCLSAWLDVVQVSLCQSHLTTTLTTGRPCDPFLAGAAVVPHSFFPFATPPTKPWARPPLVRSPPCTIDRHPSPLVLHLSRCGSFTEPRWSSWCRALSTPAIRAAFRHHGVDSGCRLCCHPTLGGTLRQLMLEFTRKARLPPVARRKIERSE